MAARGGFTHADKVANLVVACLSLLGGASIIVGYIISFSSGQNRLRQRIVLGLGVVDFIVALTVVAVSMYDRRRHAIFSAVAPTASTNDENAPSHGRRMIEISDLRGDPPPPPSRHHLLEINPLGPPQQQIEQRQSFVSSFFELTIDSNYWHIIEPGRKSVWNKQCSMRHFWVLFAVWTVTIALVTYTTLVYPLSKCTSALEKRGASWVIWGLAYLIGIVPSIVGAVVWNMVDIGGICFYEPTSLEAKIMLFIPRGIAMFVTIGIYITLFVFFQRRDLSVFGNTMSSIGDEEEDEQAITDAGLRQRLSSLVSWNRRSSDMTQIQRHSLALLPEEHLANQRPSVASEETAVTPPTRRSSAIIIALPPSSASHSADESSPEHEQMPFDRQMLSPKLRAQACPEVSILSTNYRFGSVSEAADSHVRTPDKGPRKLSARQLNRRLSLLMGLYPLAYLILFSVSVARVITQLVTNDYVSPKFAKVSRWLVLAQGFVDGILYLVIELLFRRSVRSRT